MQSSRPIHVVAAVILQADQVLIARRLPQAHQGGKWEFPGGKVDAGETVEAALVRELQEELNLTPTQFRRLIRVNHVYPDKHVLLDFWLVDAFTGEPEGREGQTIAWVSQDRLTEYEFPAANLPVLRALQLPSQLVLTPPEDIDDPALLTQLTKHKLTLLFAPQLDRRRYHELAISCVDALRASTCELLLTTDAEMVHAVDAAGLHFNRRRAMHVNERPVGHDKWFSVECHDREDLERAIRLKADFVILTPVQSETRAAEIEVLGWDLLTDCCDRLNVPVYAMGGLSALDIDRAWYSGAQGVAGVQGFWK
jgi:8-oxo-dGTP diphosphatase